MDMAKISEIATLVISISLITSTLFGVIIWVLKNKLPFVTKDEFCILSKRVTTLEEIQKLSEERSQARHQEIINIIRDNTLKVELQTQAIEKETKVFESVKEALSEVRENYNMVRRNEAVIETVIAERTGKPIILEREK